MASLFEIVSTCKGGGYRYCRTVPLHPRRNAKGLYPLHRVLMENKIGRLLERGEVVHHRDENKENNDIENLELLRNEEHSRLHRPERPNVVCVCECGNRFSDKSHSIRQRIAKSISGRIYCSKRCSAKYQHKYAF
jgi:hypothetical protein